MKRLAIILGILGLASMSHATHLFRNNASNINSGTLDPARLPDPLPNTNLDESSVTLQGNKLNISTIAQGVDSLSVSVAGLQSSLNAISRTKIFEVLVGTPGMPGVDFIVHKTSDLIAPHRALNAHGLLAPMPGGTTAYGKVLFIGGPYDFIGATIPAGITWAMIKGSSSALKPSVNGTSGTIIANYGTLENFVIDGSSQLGFSGYKIRVGSGSVIDGCEIRNFHTPARLTGSGNNLIYGKNVSSVTIKNSKFENYGSRIEGVFFGDGAAFLFDESTAVYIVGNEFGMYRGTSGGNFSAITFAKSVDWRVNENIFKHVENDFLVINGGNLYYEIDHNKFHINGNYSANRGIIGGIAQNFSHSSTGTISNNTFFHEAGASNQPIIQLVNETFDTNGVRIMFNRFINRSGGTPTGIQVQATTNHTFLLYNFCDGMTCATDAGDNTRIVQ